MDVLKFLKILTQSQSDYARKFIANFRNPKDLFDTLVPLHLVTKFIGLSPHAFDFTDGKYSYKASYIGSGYSITCILSFVAYYILAVQLSSGDVQETNKVANAIDVYQLYGSLTVMALCVIINNYNQKILINAIHDMVAVDLSIHHHDMKIDYKKARNLIFAYVILVFLTFATMEYMNCSMFLRQIGTLSTNCFLMCYVPMVVNGFMECQFICYIMLLRQRFAFVNKELCVLTRKRKPRTNRTSYKIYPIVENPNDKFTLLTLIRIRKLHWQLCHVGKLLNDAFSFQLLINTGNNFVNFTTLGYYCFDGCVKISLDLPGTDVYNTATTGIWTGFKLMQLFIICLTCTVVKNEARRTGEIIYKLENRFDPIISHEIYAFGKQIIHWNFKFTAFNFFDIDMSLFYSAVCSATTYLMILLQLDIANEQTEAFVNKSQALSSQ